MKTEEAYQQYLITANNEADFMNTILWLLFIIFMAPVLCFVGFLIYDLLTRRKSDKIVGGEVRPTAGAVSPSRPFKI
jgi:hypothetical protein